MKPLGRNIEVDLREVLNAILYINRSGCQWDMLPQGFRSNCLSFFAAVPKGPSW